MKLDKVVDRIRGAKGSHVRLQVIPANSTDPSKRKVVEITRDEVQLKDAEARGEVIDYKEKDGTLRKYGWITIPSFYNGNMEKKPGDSDPSSTTRDVRRILERLKREGIQGVVIDLRRDGGGSLEEAINLTGLFVGRALWSRPRMHPDGSASHAMMSPSHSTPVRWLSLQTVSAPRPARSLPRRFRTTGVP